MKCKCGNDYMVLHSEDDRGMCQECWAKAHEGYTGLVLCEVCKGHTKEYSASMTETFYICRNGHSTARLGGWGLEVAKEHKIVPKEVAEKYGLSKVLVGFDHSGIRIKIDDKVGTIIATHHRPPQNIMEKQGEVDYSMHTYTVRWNDGLIQEGVIPEGIHYFNVCKCGRPLFSKDLCYGLWAGAGCKTKPPENIITRFFEEKGMKIDADGFEVVV